MQFKITETIKPNKEILDTLLLEKMVVVKQQY